MGESVRMKHNSKVWQPAVVTDVVQTESGKYRRNRRFLLKTGESHDFDNHGDFNPFETNVFQSEAPVPQNSKSVSPSQNQSS